MDWLSLIVGLLLGLIAAWLFGYYSWQRKLQACLKERAELHARVDYANSQVRKLEIQNAQLRVPDGTPPAVDPQAPEVALPEVELPDAGLQAPAGALPEVELPDAGLEAPAGALPEVELPDAGLDVPAVALPAADLPEVDLQAPEVALPEVELPPLENKAPEVPRPDDLKRIEGIGPKIAKLLNEAGIRTFAQLADTNLDRLRAILQEGGPNFRLADPTTWPEQARLAAGGAWDEFQALAARLKAGRRL